MGSRRSSSRNEMGSRRSSIRNRMGSRRSMECSKSSSRNRMGGRQSIICPKSSSGKCRKSRCQYVLNILLDFLTKVLQLATKTCLMSSQPFLQMVNLVQYLCQQLNCLWTVHTVAGGDRNRGNLGHSTHQLERRRWR